MGGVHHRDEMRIIWSGENGLGEMAEFKKKRFSMIFYDHEFLTTPTLAAYIREFFQFL
jgi:hypothetical protein